jgi:hypothetical protein
LRGDLWPPIAGRFEAFELLAQARQAVVGGSLAAGGLKLVGQAGKLFFDGRQSGLELGVAPLGCRRPLVHLADLLGDPLLCVLLPLHQE